MKGLLLHGRGGRVYAFLPILQTKPSEIFLHVSVRTQTLEIRRVYTEQALKSYRISTSRFGLGSTPGSFCTPIGRFRISEKIGDGAEIGTIFKSRKPVGVAGLESADDDLVLTRILWLEGVDAHNLNTHERYIYIHGTNHEESLGQAASHGCIRMGSLDIIDLCRLVEPGVEVQITEI